MAANLRSSETGRVHNVVRSRLSNENTVYVVNCVLRILHSHNFKQSFPIYENNVYTDGNFKSKILEIVKTIHVFPLSTFGLS